MSKLGNSNPETARLAWGHDISRLQGELLTVVDGAFADPEQRKAVKDLVSQTLWRWEAYLPQLKSEGLDSPNFTIIKQDREVR